MGGCFAQQLVVCGQEEVYPRRFLESRRFDGGFVRGYLQASLPFLDGIIPNLEMAVNSAWWFSIDWE